MLLGFKTQLKVTPQQRQLLAQHAGVARHAWNLGLIACQNILQHNQENPDNRLKFPTAIDLHKWLVAEVKPVCSWYYEVSKCAPQQALRNLAQAFKDFFRGKKIRGKRVGFPQWKRKGRHDSFYLDGKIHCQEKAIKLPRIGWVKTWERLPSGYRPKSTYITREADGWFVSFKIEIEETETPKKREIVGVDLGIKTLATLSSGETFPSPQPYRTLEKKLAKLQWRNRKKIIGSQNWKKAQLKIAKLHRKIANIRKDSLHQLTTYLAKNHGMVVIEDLNVSGMMANRKLAKAIADMGFYEFRRQLEYKCQLYGSHLIVINRFYPSSKTCNSCHHVKSNLGLEERWYQCSECGWEGDRDLNAALNLEQLGQELAKVKPVDKKEPTPLVEAGINTSNRQRLLAIVSV
ncbi:MAG: RNA-guided endonuclease InsQ/TnpB family protein [Spirulina sp.]